MASALCCAPWLFYFQHIGGGSRGVRQTAQHLFSIKQAAAALISILSSRAVAHRGVSPYLAAPSRPHTTPWARVIKGVRAIHCVSRAAFYLMS